MTQMNSEGKLPSHDKIQKIPLKKESTGQYEANKEDEKSLRTRKYTNKFMKQYPELFKSDVSIHPSYTGLLNLPYYVVCRRRVHKMRKQITRQMNHEIKHMAMMQSNALAGVRIDRFFNVGFPQGALIIPDFATDKERRRIREIMREINER